MICSNETVADGNEVTKVGGNVFIISTKLI